MTRLPTSTAACARWPRRLVTYSSSRSARPNVHPMVTTAPCPSAARIAPAAIEEKYGSAMSLTISPMTVVCPLAMACACRLAE